MQNLFYVPPHQPQDQHPRVPGIKSGARRNQPERLDMTPPTALVVLRSYGVDPFDGWATAQTAPAKRPTRTLRAALGRLLIAMGRKLAPDAPLPLGQPA